MSIEPLLTDPFDIELGLIEVRDCVDEHWTLRALCGASVGVECAKALRDARDLSETLNGLLAGETAARAKLAHLLGRGGSDYQRCLWYTLAGRDPLGGVVDLARLVEILDARRWIADRQSELEGEIITVREPYLYDKPDGPVGVFKADFMPGSQWAAFAGL